MKKLYFPLLIIASIFYQPALCQTAETVVGWTSWVNFLDFKADQGVAANKNITVLTATGGAGPVVFSDVDGNGTSQRAYSLGWDNGANTKAWQFQFSTAKYSSLQYSCRMSGTNDFFNFLGPRDFQFQYSTNGSTWVNVGGVLQAGNGYNTFNSISNLSLPAACENQPILYLRMFMKSNVAVNGGTVNGGQSHIDDILVNAVSIPEAPTDIALSNSVFIIPTGGSVSSGAVVGTLSSTDFNLGNTFTYSLVSGAGDTHNSSFSLSNNTLSTAADLVAGNYSIRVRSTDNSSLFYEKILIIKVVPPDPVAQGSRQRISSMGTNGATTFTPNSPVNICYNSTNNEYLSVWYGDDNTAPLVDNENEVFGQRINANTGLAIGGKIRISFMGPDGNTTYRGLNPSVAYSATNNEYFVVWQGDHNTGALASTEDEIWGQRINGATGALVSTMIRISTMGADGNASFDAQNPDVSWNSVNNQYMVVWRADDNTSPLVDNEYEVYGQVIGSGGILSGSRTRISAMGADGNALYGAFTPVVSYNATDNKYFVVWRADDNTGLLADNEYEIYGQLLSNAGVLSGSRIRISYMGADGVTTLIGQTPDVTWSSTKNEFFVVWSGDDTTAPLVDGENEIFGQIVTSPGILSGSRKRFSNMGPDGVTTYAASSPKVVYYASLDEYWIVWNGDDNSTSVDNEQEIFLQRVNSSGTEVGTNDIRISFMGPASNTSFTALQPAIAYNSTNNKAFAEWYGDDNTSPLIDNEFEIFGQSLFGTAILPVTWLSFTAEMLSNETILLNWKTASEWNTKQFTVQRSSTASNWSNIGTQVAATNSIYVQDYNFIDAKPIAGKNYYRLVQTDLDGVYTYSKVVLIENSELSKFAVFPNPAAKYLTIQVPKSGKLTVKIFNNSGNLIMQQQHNERNFVLDVESLSPGIYNVQILQNGNVYNQKFVKK